jgi:uncharacterized repeat protein (TIGR03803 family)
MRLNAAVCLCLLALVVSLGPVAHAQTFNVIYTFTGGVDGAAPAAGLTMDKGGNLYGTASAGGRGFSGTVYKLTPNGAGWAFNPLYNFAGGNDGAAPIARVVFGPNGTLYGTTSDQGEGQGVVGTVFNLIPPVTVACRTIFCPWTEKVLHRFTGLGTDGFIPGYGDLVFDHAGNLYGTTIQGGTNGTGIVYELTAGDWTETILYNMTTSSGIYPYNGVIFDQAGNLYGTTYEGGIDTIYGSIYELMPAGSGWTQTTLHSLIKTTDGALPYGGVIFDQAGNLYGTASYSGPDGAGTVFELVPTNGSWTFTVLHSFAGSEGPYGGLTMDAAGNLYGTTFAGGVNQHGSVYKLTRSGAEWTYTDLYDFTAGNDGSGPYGTVAVDAKGNLYGTASHDGVFGYGTVWEIMP